jgi:hypothetical protein
MRAGIMTTECPKPVITAASREWLQLFAVWKSFGAFDFLSMPAKAADAIALLEAESRRELQNVEIKEQG